MVAARHCIPVLMKHVLPKFRNPQTPSSALTSTKRINYQVADTSSLTFVILDKQTSFSKSLFCFFFSKKENKLCNLVSLWFVLLKIWLLSCRLIWQKRILSHNIFLAIQNKILQAQIVVKIRVANFKNFHDGKNCIYLPD